jgi:hypothetical protein
MSLRQMRTAGNKPGAAQRIVDSCALQHQGICDPFAAETAQPGMLQRQCQLQSVRGAAPDKNTCHFQRSGPPTDVSLDDPRVAPVCYTDGNASAYDTVCDTSGFIYFLQAVLIATVRVYVAGCCTGRQHRDSSSTRTFKVTLQVYIDISCMYLCALHNHL